MKIEGKVAAIIGGARGIGKAIAEALLQKGAKVFIGDILEDKGKATEKELASQFGKDNVRFVKCDITNDTDLEDFFKAVQSTFGRLEIFCPTAAIVDEFDWRKCLKVNQDGSIASTYEAMKYMSRAKGEDGGVVILFSSNAVASRPGFGPIYTTGKAGLVSFVQCWAENFDETGIRFNCLSPKFVDTDMMNDLCPGKILHGDKVQAVLSDIPKLKPAQVAQGFIHLVENDSVNGEALRIAGDPDPGNLDLIPFERAVGPKITKD